MSIGREEAYEIIQGLLLACQECNEALKVVKSNDSLGRVKEFGKLTGQFMGNTYTNVLAPLWKKFPELQPAELQAPFVEQKFALSVASQEQIERFLKQAHEAMRQIEEVVSHAERETLFQFDGISEIRQWVSEIERFLASEREGSLPSP